jgi:hypothetical protein
MSYPFKAYLLTVIVSKSLLLIQVLSFKLWYFVKHLSINKNRTLSAIHDVQLFPSHKLILLSGI